jgi:hypothetical protein
VVGGQVVDLAGGVYSSGDDPVVDFQTFDPLTRVAIPNTFSASGGVVWPAIGETTRVLVSGTGAMMVTPVPTPAAAWLLGAALTGLAAFSRRAGR